MTTKFKSAFMTKNRVRALKAAATRKRNKKAEKEAIKSVSTATPAKKKTPMKKTVAKTKTAAKKTDKAIAKTSKTAAKNTKIKAGKAVVAKHGKKVGKGSPGKAKSAAHRAAISAALKAHHASKKKTTAKVKPSSKPSTRFKDPKHKAAFNKKIDTQIKHLTSNLAEAKDDLKKTKKDRNGKSAVQIRTEIKKYEEKIKTLRSTKLK